MCRLYFRQGGHPDEHGVALRDFVSATTDHAGFYAAGLVSYFTMSRRNDVWLLSRAGARGFYEYRLRIRDDGRLWMTIVGADGVLWDYFLDRFEPGCADGCGSFERQEVVEEVRNALLPAKCAAEELPEGSRGRGVILSSIVRVLALADELERRSRGA